MDIQEIFKQNLKYISQLEADVEVIQRQFVKTETRFFLIVGEIDCPSGRIVVADPLAYLPAGQYSPQMALTIPAGTYPVEVALCRNRYVGIRMCTARLKVKATEAVKYVLAQSTSETAIYKAADGDMSGFPVEAGMMCFCDAEVAMEYSDFIDRWHAENEGKNHYDDYFAQFLAESAAKLPAFQRADGDFLEWAIPASRHRMVMIAPGFGDGLYQCFWGYDTEGEICELIVPMANPDLIEQAEIRPKNWEGPRGCMATKRITEDGCRIGYMYRDEPIEGCPDSGWQFLEGTEDGDYLDDPNNAGIYDIGEICELEPDIEPFLKAPVGSEYIRDEKGNWILLEE